MPAELPLVPSAIALAGSALLFFNPRRGRGSHRLGIALVVLGTLLPITLDPFVDPTRAAGRALWEWSAVGGPTIQAAYHVDALSTVALALVIAYAGAALATAGRAERRHPALAALLLAIGLVAIALVVTDDLVAAIVVLAVLAALTVLALFASAPVAATARAAAYLSIGLQAWVLAALLVSRSGSPTFLLGAVPEVAVTPGALLAATGGALLFAGLYPVVAWGVDQREAARDPGPLGSLVLMPAGIGATLLLVRLVGASGLAPTDIVLPDLGPETRLAIVVLVLLGVAVSIATSGTVPPRPIVAGTVTIVLVAALPYLGWAHLVLLAAILTAAYAGVVSLAFPDHWETVRSDLALVAIWIAVATGSPLAVAGGIVALFARAAAALASSLWLVPHRDYVAFVAGSAVFVAGAIVVGAGAVTMNDPVPAALGAGAAGLLVALELTQVGRRFRVADVPAGLDLASAISAFLLALLATIIVVPLEAALRAHLPAPEAISATHIGAIAGGAALAVVLARTVRPLLPYFEAAAERSGIVMRALDPAPIAVGAFRTLELAATRANVAFGLFERRAGVWLATAVILALLVWSVR
jgi:hypothetical protein